MIWVPLCVPHNRNSLLQGDVWRSLYSQKSKGCPPAPSGNTAELERGGSAVILSPADAPLGVSALRDQLKERGQYQQNALQDLVSA